MRRWLVAVALLAGAGCTSQSSPAASGPRGSADPQRAHLVAVAHLRSCPASTAAPVASGGLPAMTLQCLGNGPAVRMGALAGKPTVVNLWGSWCPPCQAEAKYLSSAYDVDHREVRFLGVDVVDDPDSALDFGAHVTPPVRYPSVLDPNRRFAGALHVTSPPFTAFVAADGRIVHTQHGAYTSTAQVQHDIATYLHVRA